MKEFIVGGGVMIAFFALCFAYIIAGIKLTEWFKLSEFTGVIIFIFLPVICLMAREVGRQLLR